MTLEERLAKLKAGLLLQLSKAGGGGNPYHDQRGRFTHGSGAYASGPPGSAAGAPRGGQRKPDPNYRAPPPRHQPGYKNPTTDKGGFGGHPQLIADPKGYPVARLAPSARTAEGLKSFKYPSWASQDTKDTHDFNIKGLDKGPRLPDQPEHLARSLEMSLHEDWLNHKARTKKK